MTVEIPVLQSIVIFQVNLLIPYWLINFLIPQLLSFCRPLIGALSFEEQSQLDQSQGDQGAKCAQEPQKNQGESLVQYTTLSSHDEEAKKMQQSGLPTAFGTKKRRINSSKKCEVESEIPDDDLSIKLRLIPYLFCKYTKKFAMNYMEKCKWEKGTGIGKTNQGITYPLEQTRPYNDCSGLGFPR